MARCLTVGRVGQRECRLGWKPPHAGRHHRRTTGGLIRRGRHLCDAGIVGFCRRCAQRSGGSIGAAFNCELDQHALPCYAKHLNHCCQLLCERRADLRAKACASNCGDRYCRKGTGSRRSGRGSRRCRAAPAEGAVWKLPSQRLPPPEGSPELPVRGGRWHCPCRRGRWRCRRGAGRGAAGPPAVLVSVKTAWFGTPFARAITV